MTTSLLTLDGVTFALPDGRQLFSDLCETFDRRRTGLVGRNGVGKSVLARLLAGDIEPSHGRCIRAGRTHYLPQRVADTPASVAELAGFGPVIDALARIEAGGTDHRDFDLVDDRWDIRERLRSALKDAGLGRLEASSLTTSLSGGECMRVALLGAALSKADMLILDEPSNHLDIDGSADLLAWLRDWMGGLLVISHDRVLLEGMERIVELSSLGLRSYGGNYSFYAQARAAERHSAIEHVDRIKTERKQQERAVREQQEARARRKARGDRDGRDANDSRLLLGLRKRASEVSAGKATIRMEAVRAELDERVRTAAGKVATNSAVTLIGPVASQVPQRKVATLDGVRLPHIEGPLATIDLHLRGGQRIGLVGPNGSGKSLLLKVLGGLLAPLAGHRDVRVTIAWLDQRLSTLDPSRSLVAQIGDAEPGMGEDVLRTRLALLGLDASVVVKPAGMLSGGEQLKAALARIFLAPEPPGLLLLDEPGNHLDLESLDALETMLGQYRGTLVVVSHDNAFLDRLVLTDRLSATPQGWRMTPC